MGGVGSERRFDSKAWWSTTRRFAGSCASMTCSPRFVAATTTIDSDHDQPIFPNLAEGLTPDGPDQLWVADITYVPVIGGFVYVAMVLDAWSRRVVGYAISRSINIRLTLAGFGAAVAERKPPRAACTIRTADRNTPPRPTATSSPPAASTDRWGDAATRTTTPRPRAS